MIKNKEKIFQINTMLFVQIIALLFLVCCGQIRFFIKDAIIIILGVIIWASLNSSYDRDKDSKTFKLLNPHENFNDE